MALYTVVQGAIFNAQDINQVVNDLQKPAGTQETGNYAVTGNNNLNNSTAMAWIVMRSKNLTPISVTVDTSITSPAEGAGSPITSNFTITGFQVYVVITGTGNKNARAAGAWTASF